MEKHVSGSVSPSAARQRLEAARRAREVSVRRTAKPVGLILSVSLLCGAMTLAPAHQGLGSVVTIVAVSWLVAEILLMSARNQWRALRLMPRPKWSLLEVTLTCAAVVLGGFVGPHLLASSTNSTFVSRVLAGGVAVAVAVLLLGADVSYRRRSVRA